MTGGWDGSILSNLMSSHSIMNQSYYEKVDIYIYIDMTGIKYGMIEYQIIIISKLSISP
jgi:hypothetical protein